MEFPLSTLAQKMHAEKMSRLIKSDSPEVLHILYIV